MNWIFLTMVAAVLESISNIYDRFVLKNELKTSDTMISLWGFFAGIMFCGPALISGLVVIDQLAVTFGLASALFYLISMHYYYKAVNSGEVNRVVPILSLNPVIILVLATIFLNEIHDTIRYLGIGLIIIGVLIHTIDEQRHRIINKKAIIWACLAATTFAIKNILIKWQVIHNIDPLNTLFWVGLFIFVLNIPFTIAKRHSWKIKNKKVWPDLLVAATLGAATTLTYSAAIASGPASLVAFLHRIQILFVFLISSLLDFFKPQLLHEQFNKAAFFQKLSGVMFILIGSYFLI